MARRIRLFAENILSRRKRRLAGEATQRMLSDPHLARDIGLPISPAYAPGRLPY